MRILRHHSILRCIYALLIVLPMFSVLGRVIYTQSNKNAKDSYYGENINQKQFVNVNENNLVTGNTYTYDTTNYTSYTGAREYIYIENLVVVNATTQYPNATIIDLSSGYVVLRDNNNSYLNEYNLNNIKPIFEFTYISSTIPLNNPWNSFFYEWQYNKYSYLDNAFDYSLSRFVDENHWGKINFFDWFTSLFVDINYNNNALYLHFINWYMNYAMLVSCAYILFLVLMWFINFSRRLLERGMNYDW